MCTGMRLRPVSETQDTDSVNRNNRKPTGQISDIPRDREKRNRQTGEEKEKHVIKNC